MFHPAIQRLAGVCLVATLLLPSVLPASEITDQAAVAIGVSAGNLVFVPVKAITVTWGVAAGGLAYLFFGGDSEMARKIWEDTSRGPYFITPEIARAAVGRRPEMTQE